MSRQLRPVPLPLRSRRAARGAASMEHYLSNTLVFAIGLPFLALGFAVWCSDTTPPQALGLWYGGLTHAGFLTFAMQILVVVVAGYVLGRSPSVHLTGAVPWKDHHIATSIN